MLLGLSKYFGFEDTMNTKLMILSVFAVLILSGFLDESFAEQRIKLHYDQTISTHDLEFTLHDVDDSRCPSDVTCVWEGQVIATVQIQNQTHMKTVDFMPNDSYTFFSPYKIILLDVSPYPISTEKNDDYIVTFEMFSLDGTPPCEKHMTIRDGLCIPESLKPSDFRESGEGYSLLYTFASLGLVVIVVGFFVIKKWKNRR